MPLNAIRPNISKTSASLIAGGAIAAALLGVSMGLASPQFEPRAQEREQDLRIGTYEPQRVFQASHYAATLTERVSDLQQQAQEAQAEGDHQRAMELQGQMQAAQSEVVQAFLSEVEGLVPEVARESGVKIVALEVVWTDPEVGEPKDLSGQLIEQINEDADDAPAPPRSPFEAPDR